MGKVKIKVQGQSRKAFNTKGWGGKGRNKFQGGQGQDQVL